MESLTEVEKKLVRIYSQHELIRNTPPDRQELEIKRMIVTVCGLLGIKNLPDQLTTTFVLRFIREHYGGLSVEAMIHAFELNAAGILCEKRHEHFQNFGIEFIADVLGDYVETKRNVNKKVKGLLSPKSTETIVSDEDAYIFLVDFYRKNKSLPMIFSWDKVYFHMMENNMVTESIAWMKSFRFEVEQKMKLEKVSDMLSAGAILSGSISDDSIQFRCRKEYVKFKLPKIVENA